ncbi:MAG: hypothetical protein K6C11_01555 [Bacilli bacterium]|nr:hypothetical protein [Bacilli bacterium]
MVDTINNRGIKIIIIGVLMLLMLFMVFQFPSSKATSDEEQVVSIR